LGDKTLHQSVKGLGREIEECEECVYTNTMIMKLGNVIYQNDLVDHQKVEYINYVQRPITFQELNTNIPTLYVGWFSMKEINTSDMLIQNQPILDKKIISNILYWEFSFKENKAQHVEGVNYFVKNVPYYFFNVRYSYINLDPIMFRIGSIRELMDVLPKSFDAIYNFNGDMLYILKDNKITGIDLNMYEHFEFDIDELLQTIHKKVPIQHIYNDFDGEIYQKHYKIFPNFDELKRYLIVLLSKA